MSESGQVYADVQREIERTGVAVLINGAPVQAWIAPVLLEPDTEYALTMATMTDLFMVASPRDYVPGERVALALQEEQLLTPPGGISTTPMYWDVVSHRRAGATIRLRVERAQG